MIKMLKFTELDKLNAIAIFGRTGSGKTALSFSILEEFKNHKPIYILNHPKPELMEEMGYINLNTMDEIVKLQDCVIYWDEPQLSVLGVQEYKRDSVLAKFMSLARQKDINLIVSSSDSRTFSPKVEQYFEAWFVKDCDYSLTKQRSMLRTIIKNNTTFFPEEFELNDDEAIFYSKKLKGKCGKMKISLPSSWSNALSKPFKQEVYVQRVEKDVDKSENLSTSSLFYSPYPLKTQKTQ